MLDMSEASQLLLKIAEDVASIKTEISGLQKADVKQDTTFKEQVADLSARISMNKKDIDALGARIRSLEGLAEKEDAEKWRKVVGFVLAGIGGLLVAQLPIVLKVFLNGN